MGTRFKAENPDSHEYTMTMTMPLGDWTELRDQLYGGKTYAAWPASTLTSAINDMVSQAQKIYWPEDPDDRDLNQQE